MPRQHLVSVLEKTANLLAAKTGIRVDFGDGCYNAGGRIVLPNLAETDEHKGKGDEELLDLIAGYLDHEVAHEVHSDFELMRSRTDKGKKMKLKFLWNVFEDGWIEREHIKLWRGSAVNLERKNEMCADKIAQKWAKLDPLCRLGLSMRYIRFGIIPWHKVHKKIDDTARRLIDKIVSQEETDILVSSVQAMDLAEKVMERLGLVETKWKKMSLSELLDCKDPDEDEKESEPGEDDEEEESDIGKIPDEVIEVEAPSSEPGDEEDEDDQEESESDQAQTAAGGGEEEDGGSAPKPQGAATGDSEEEKVGSDAESSEGEKEDPVGQLASKCLNGDDEDLQKNQDDFSAKKLINVKTKKEQVRLGKSSSWYRARTTEEDTLVKVRVSNPDEALRKYRQRIEAAEKQVPVLRGRMKSALASLYQDYWEGNHLRGRLNTSALAKFKSTGDTRIFKNRIRMSSVKGTAVGIWIDHSDSMNESGFHIGKKGNGEIDLALGVAGVLGEILSPFNIAFEIGGFTTSPGDALLGEWEEKNPGKTPPATRWGKLRLAVYKSFVEDFQIVKHRLGIDPGSPFPDGMYNSYEGEALLAAAKRLEARPEERKILFLLTDGQPYVDCDEFLENSRWYVRHVSKKIQRLTNIELIGVGIQTDHVSWAYDHYICIHDLKDVGKEILGRLLSILYRGAKVRASKWR